MGIGEGAGDDAEWLVGGGDVGDRIRAMDWSATPLGPRAAWPAALRTALNMVLSSRFPIALVWGPERIRLYNDACRPICADRHPWGLGRSVAEIFPEVWDELRPIFDGVMTRGESSYFEERLFPLDRDGRREEAYFTIGYSPVYLADGAVGGVLVTLQETTALLRQQRSLREREALLRTILENSSDGINMLDLRTGRYVFMSPAQVELTGFTVEEMNGFTVEEAYARVHPDDRAISIEQQRRVVAGEDPGPAHAEYRWRVKSGEYRWFSDSRRLIRDENGEAVAMVGVSREITEQKAAEAAIQRANARLAEAVEEAEERSRRLRASEEKLQHLNEELARADEAKNRFLAVLSHELRNPLTPIQMGLEILGAEPSPNEKTRRALGIIGRQVDRLSRLVDDLLDLNRIQSGKIELRRASVDLRALTVQAAEDHQATLDRAGVALDVALGPAPVIIDADAERIAQVIGNLLQNAVKYTPKGGHVEVSVAADVAAGEAILRVADDGVGIDAELLDRVFDPFVQADRSLERSASGLGLGLALVKEVAMLHGGVALARSEGEGRGAELIVRLPLARSAARSDARPPPRVRSEALRVLVVEDSVDVAEILQEVLRQEGHVVAVAHDGPSA
ncbi:MAG: PAS domain S-box protein, partial [Myxococcales bacterium]|nr:PAS domain S-box protein [Myxococcales bacterium]